MRTRSGFLSVLLLALPGVCLGQDVEPRRWTHLPIGLDVVGTAYVYTDGDIAFDPVLMIDDAETEQHTFVGTYTHSFGLAGRTGRVDVLVPVRDARWAGKLEGQPASRRHDGFGDPVVRLSVNLAGGPALKGEEFREYRAAHKKNTIVGAGLNMVLPFGEYQEDKLLNISGNRLVLQPQIGMVHTRGPWSYEMTGSVFLFEENDEFFDGNKLEQDPLYALQGHLIYVFRPGLWVSVSVAYGWDGESEVNDVPKDDPKDQFLSALSFGLPVGKKQGMKFAYIRGRKQQETGADTDNLLVAWTRRF